jgi:hypothetical protein
LFFAGGNLAALKIEFFFQCCSFAWGASRTTTWEL